MKKIAEDKNRGLYEKFIVNRTDGKSELGEKHEHCQYFVLDLDHDEFAMAALRAYAEACEEKYPKLAVDLHLTISGKKLSKTSIFSD